MALVMNENLRGIKFRALSLDSSLDALLLPDIHEMVTAVSAFLYRDIRAWHLITFYKGLNNS
jgi:hypothetical protein